MRRPVNVGSKTLCLATSIENYLKGFLFFLVIAVRTDRMRPTTPMPRQKAQKEKMPPKNSFGASRWHPFPLGAGPATFCF